MSSNFVTSSEPYISGDLFISYSSLVLTSVLDTTSLALTPNIIIFVATDLLEYYLPFLLSLTVKFVLITTCNDDYCLPYYHFPCKQDIIKEKHDNLLESSSLFKWFTKNPSIVHKKLAPIPLGPKWQYFSTQFFGEDKQPIIKILDQLCLTPLENFTTNNKTELLYFNFDESTSNDTFFKEHRNIRVMLAHCYAGMFEKSKGGDFFTYLTELKKYKFCLSPPGRGIDCHRTWESLMVGTIPIVVSSPIDSLFNDLPVLIVDDLLKITPDLLKKEYENIRNKKYDFSKLYSPYWKHQIDNCFLSLK